MPKPPQDLPPNYPAFLDALKERIHAARLKAALAVNRELVLLYWSIGRDILAKQEAEGWGTKVIERLGRDLASAFPGMKGLSRTNLLYMRALAVAYPDERFVQEVLGQITWYHNITLLDKVKDPREREWYMRQTVENGWSRNVLVLQIEGGLYGRQGKALTNFSRALPDPYSDLAQQLTKNEYNFEFLDIGAPMREREIERGLVENIRSFILELGRGFAFLGSQHHIVVSGKDYYIDLLFYHVRLRCYVVFELKATDFKPEYAGKMNFYLSAVDDLLRHPDDKPSIGIILCKYQDAVDVEYAMRDMNKPMGVAQFRVTSELPARLQGDLPTPAELAARMRRALPKPSKKRPR